VNGPHRGVDGSAAAKIRRVELRALEGSGDAVGCRGPLSRSAAILEPVCAFSGQPGEDCCRDGDGDDSDYGDSNVSAEVKGGRTKEQSCPRNRLKTGLIPAKANLNGPKVLE